MPLANRDTNVVYASRPAVDEWGIYDPDQAGLSALFDRIESRRAAAVSDTDAQAIAKSMREANALMTAVPK